MFLKPTVLLSLLITFPQLITSAPATTTCLAAFVFAYIDPVCTPIKAGSISLTPPPKFVFSAGNYCATFNADFASLKLVPDAIPAGLTCTVTTYGVANCQGTASTTTTLVPNKCITVGLLPVPVSGISKTAISAKLTCP